MELINGLKAFAQVLLDTSEDIPGDTVAAVFQHLAENYAPGEASVADGSVTEAKLDETLLAKIAKADTALQPGEIELAAGSPTNAAKATKTLTISGVVKHGETVTLGGQVYRFAADAAQEVAEGEIAVDIESDTTKATNNLTVDTHPALGDTFIIEDNTYTIVPTSSANGQGDVARGADLAACQANIVAAINGTDGHNDPHPLVTCGAFADDVAAITALAGGTAGNSIDTTETFTAGTNAFSAAALATGADCLAPAAVTALVGAITDNDENVDAADGAGDTVVVTAKESGTAGNSIALAKSMANGAWAGAATALSGGAAGTVGVQWQTYVDATYLYVAIAANTVTGANWRRVALGSAY
jgi:hypothetical protein